MEDSFKFAFMYSYKNFTERIKSLFDKDSIEDTFRELEMSQNERTVKLLWNFNIKASTKTDPKSLPYTKEIVIYNKFNSYVNSVFFIEKLYRKVIKQLIEDDTYKIRFYFDYDLDYNKEKEDLIEGLKISFRYYPHEYK